MNVSHRNMHGGRLKLQDLLDSFGENCSKIDSTVMQWQFVKWYGTHFLQFDNLFKNKFYSHRTFDPCLPWSVREIMLTLICKEASNAWRMCSGLL